MTRFNDPKDEVKPKKSESPVWKGIGCLLLGFVPMAGYGIAAWFEPFAYNQDWYRMVRVGIPDPTQRIIIWTVVATIAIFTLIALAWGIYASFRGQWKDPVEAEMQSYLNYQRELRRAKGYTKRRRR